MARLAGVAGFAGITVEVDPFYKRLNGLLSDAQFDGWIEGRCRQYCDEVPTGTAQR